MQDSTNVDSALNAAFADFDKAMNEYNDAVSGGLFAMGMGLMIFLGVFVLFMIICMWKVYTKAGKPGWACLVPIYNIIVLLEICGKPWWWFFLMLIPLVNFIILIIIYIELAKSFGQGAGFAIGLL